MKRKTILVLSVLIFALVRPASAEIEITDADAIYEVSLQSVTVPTKPLAVMEVFIGNADAVSEQVLSTVSVATEPLAISKIFISNADAVLTETLVPMMNQLPVASFTYSPEEAVVGQSITFDGSSSYDPDGSITNYQWRFGDGSTGEGKVVTHSYSSEGDYTVTLTVTDNNGASGTTTKTVQISPGVSIAKGDVNGDGQINILDLVKIVNYITEKDTLSAEQFARADIAPFGADGTPKGDGTVNILDIVGIVDMIVYPEKHGVSAKMALAKPVSCSRAIVRLTKLKAGLVSLDLESEVPISGIQFVLRYDPEEAEPQDVLTTERSSGMSLSWSAGEGKLVVLLYSPGGQIIPSGRGSVFQIRFVEKMESPSFTIEEILLSDPDANPVPVSVKGITLVEAQEVGAKPESYVLFQNYPNPTNAGTTIMYGLPKESTVRLAVYNTAGQLVRVLVDRTERPGYRNVYWDGRDEAGKEVASGMYLYRLVIRPLGEDERFSAVRKIVVLR